MTATGIATTNGDEAIAASNLAVGRSTPADQPCQRRKKRITRPVTLKDSDQIHVGSLPVRMTRQDCPGPQFPGPAAIVAHRAVRSAYGTKLSCTARFE
jgi:hypothetical protein